jgi:hypothetical protein
MVCPSKIVRLERVPYACVCDTLLQHLCQLDKSLEIFFKSLEIKDFLQIFTNINSQLSCFIEESVCFQTVGQQWSAQTASASEGTLVGTPEK